MAPSTRKGITTRANNKPAARRMMTRSIYKKQLQSNNSSSEANKSSDSAIFNDGKENVCYDVVCSTPRGKKYKIPEISTCPPAPKKSRRLVLKTTTKTNFFTHPDLDLFFLFSPSREIHA